MRLQKLIQAIKICRTFFGKRHSERYNKFIMIITLHMCTGVPRYWNLLQRSQGDFHHQMPTKYFDSLLYDLQRTHPVDRKLDNIQVFGEIFDIGINSQIHSRGTISSVYGQPALLIELCTPQCDCAE
jgi:hypothetical protein